MPHQFRRRQTRRNRQHSAGSEAIELDATLVADPGNISALRATLLAEHAHLVKSIAHHLFRRRTYVDVDDLIEAGMAGLEEAMRGRGHDTSVDFEAFASTFIRGAMLEFVRKANWSPGPIKRGKPPGNPSTAA